MVSKIMAGRGHHWCAITVGFAFLRMVDLHDVVDGANSCS